MNDLLHAKEQIKYHKLCLVKGKDSYISDKNGIQSLVDFIDRNMNFSGFSAADIIVGKAAALLYSYMGVKEVYAKVLSKKAIPIFEMNHIYYEYGILTDNIINRLGNGLCPMEQSVIEISDPKDALVSIKNTLNKIHQK